MLKLHSLSISGFKSFPDPVGVDFAGGITAIVGPNGCGKSNLSDAVTWVLGEQSVKSLRGSKMEDVIFNGTGRRKPVGMAEATLTLRTEPGVDHAVDGKIRIGRRVFRTGVSQYRLNGKVVRLKEIKDLLMDTGLGIRAYSVIEQGKIGMILSGKPQERRKLLEEAAGITRYKARKRLAELKLEEATANLLRLDDIISEVERALRSLKRQAGAARRYQTKQGEYRDLLKQVLLGRWSLLRDRLTSLAEELSTLTDRDAEMTADLHRGEADLARGREELDELAGVLAERHREQADLGATIEGRQEFLKGARQRSVEMRQRLEQGRTEADERRRRSAVLERSLEDLDDRGRELLDERDSAARRVAEDDAEIAACQEAVEGSIAELESLRQSLLASIARINQARSALQREHVEIEKKTYRRRFLDDERQRLDRQLEDSRAALETIDGRLRELEARVTESLERRREAAEGLDQLLRREAELGDEERRLEARLGRLEERQRILVELSEEHAERRRSLVDQLAAIGLAEPRFLADVAAPVEGWEESIDHFLGDLADAVVLDPGADGLALAEALAELDASGVFLRPLAEREPAAGVADPALAGLRPLAEALDLPAELARALPPAYLTASAADAARLAVEHPGVAFLSPGRLWARDGALWVQGEEAAPGVLARESELEAIRREIPEASERRTETADALAALVEERTRRAADLHRLEEEIAELRRELAVAQARRQDVAGRRRKLEVEDAAVAGEQQQIDRELGDRSARQGELEAGLEDAEGEHEELSRRFEEAQEAVAAAKDEREARRTAGAGRRGRLELLEERLESQQVEAVRLRDQLREAGEQLAAWRLEEERLNERLAELEEEMTAAEGQLQLALEGKAAAEDRVLAQQEILDRRREELRELEAQVQELRAEREELRSEIEERRVGQAGLRQDAEHLAVTYAEEFKRALPGSGPWRARREPAEEVEGAEEAAPEPSDASDLSDVSDRSDRSDRSDLSDEDAAAAVFEDEDLPEDDVDLPAIDRGQLAELEGELARVKAILERLGPVNVLAAQEYEEQRERREFLVAQRQDVASSVESLRATISEINAISSERFRETFAVVNEKFGVMFTKLFRGGEAEMRLFDEEDLLESGIEIIARPPGKRFQNLLLLSGGEKALTAIALLFALFQAKPSPFCILDEVDAPLDDVNVLRFVDTLRELAEETQFLIITHNKLTMEVAGTLYGVTMEERGVSKLVSVEIDRIQADIEDAAATA
jgi:chromosome segregation protein